MQVGTGHLLKFVWQEIGAGESNGGNFRPVLGDQPWAGILLIRKSVIKG
jgi:hypothetical protein